MGRERRSSYEAVVFAGGGCRCFWQAGFWREVEPALGLAPSVVGAVSAGAAMACAAFAHLSENVLEDFTRRVDANPRNAYPANVLRGGRVFPHQDIYYGSVIEALDAAAVQRLHAGPEIRICVGRPPGWSGSAGYLLGLAAFLAEQLSGPQIHGRWGRRLGFRDEQVSVRECPRPEDLAELILQSSCTPPITRSYRRDGGAVIDGGIVDRVPVDAVGAARSSLVLLTRHYQEASLPHVEGRTYVQPSEPIPISKWDYTSPDLVRRTYELGRSDGASFAKRHPRRHAA